MFEWVLNAVGLTVVVLGCIGFIALVVAVIWIIWLDIRDEIRRR